MTDKQTVAKVRMRPSAGIVSFTGQIPIGSAGGSNPRRQPTVSDP